ncbi:hypothetical protein ACHAXT_012602 [Thalassiosira profunda]
MALASAKSEREGFLRRLEEQAQQQEGEGQEAAPDEEDAEGKKGAGEEGGPTKAEAAEGGAGLKSPPEEIAEKSSPPESAKMVAVAAENLKSPPEDNMKPSSNGNDQHATPTGDQLLLDYLAKYCDPAAASPESWIGDVDASSLAFLKGLAGIREVPPVDPAGGSPLVGPPGATPLRITETNSGAEFTVPCAVFQEEPPIESMAGWPAGRYATIVVPLAAVPGESFPINCWGKAARVVCPADARAGQRIRFPLPKGWHRRAIHPAEYRGCHTAESYTDFTGIPMGTPEAKPLFYTQSNCSAGDDSAEFRVDGTVFQGDPAKEWEVTVPPFAVPGEPFLIKAMGREVSVVCPTDAREGQRIRFNLPADWCERPPEVPPFDPDARLKLGEGAPKSDGVKSEEASKPNEDKSGKPIDSTQTQPEDAKTTNEKETDNTSDTHNQSIEERMLSLIERQQRQMDEMQARLDALGGMVASVDQNVRYLKERQQFGQIQEWSHRRQHAPRAQIGGYRIMGGLFGGAGRPSHPGQAGQGGELYQSWLEEQQRQRQWECDMGYRRPPPEQPGVPEAVAYRPGGGQPPSVQANQPGPPVRQPRDQPPQPPRPNQQPAQLPPLRQPQPPAWPHMQQAPQPQAGARPVAHIQRQPVPAAAGQRPPNQGIFFPIFATLFSFLFSLPGRLRAVLLSSGPGRVYAHLRERAIEQQAFANVDLGSVLKLLVMLLIFAGRAGGRDDGRGRNNRRNNVREEAMDGMVAYAFSLLRTFIDFWNGHRVHTLVLASFVAFLIQVGLMSFFYQVLWVEREDLLRAYLGQDPPAAEEDVAGADAPATEGQAGANGGADQAPARPNNAAARGRPGRGPPAAAAAPHAGLIRRGPNNGGIIHDIQCLLLSFLLSLIPAWRPEDAAREPEARPEAAEQPATDPAPEEPDPQQGRAEQPADEAGEDGTDAAE